MMLAKKEKVENDEKKKKRKWFSYVRNLKLLAKIFSQYKN